jgi:hypothetical protein
MVTTSLRGVRDAAAMLLSTSACDVKHEQWILGDDPAVSLGGNLHQGYV